MVFEEIIRYGPRRRASSRIAEGVMVFEGNCLPFYGKW